MELTLSPEDAAFRNRGACLDCGQLSVGDARPQSGEEQMLLCHCILHKTRSSAPLWTKQYRGPGWSITHRFICEQDASRAIGIQYHHGLPVHLHVISTLKSTTPRDQDVH